jgi:hypothetical protein
MIPVAHDRFPSIQQMIRPNYVFTKTSAVPDSCAASLFGAEVQIVRIDVFSPIYTVVCPEEGPFTLPRNIPAAVPSTSVYLAQHNP